MSKGLKRTINFLKPKVKNGLRYTNEIIEDFTNKNYKNPSKSIVTTEGIIIEVEECAETAVKTTNQNVITNKKATGKGKTSTKKTTNRPNIQKTKDGLVKPLGKGSTGRTTARTLEEQIAMKEVMSDPYPKKGGGRILEKITMSDDINGWLAKDGWKKMQYLVKYVNSKGEQIQIKIHYLWNKMTNMFDDFKFVNK